MPTFVFILKHGERGRIQGGNMAAVEKIIIENMPPSSSSTPKDPEKTATYEERKWLEHIVNQSEQVQIFEL